MDLHIIINILLNYFVVIEQWTAARSLCKSSKEIVDGLDYDRASYGRPSMFEIGVCEVCQQKKTKNEIKWLRYCAEISGIFRFTPHCKHWKCHMSAIYSMINDYKKSGIRILRKPFSDDKKCDVPRSDGTVTRAECKTNFIIWSNIVHEYCVYTYWTEKDDKMYKVVPLKHFTSDKPLILFE
tara:strand:+ start:185 stop:730 length:546 start_codon:yes stop_codon:yes gene_type:complete